MRERRRQSGNTCIRQIHDALYQLYQASMIHGQNEWVATLESSSPEKHTSADEVIDLFHFHILLKTTSAASAQVASHKQIMATFFHPIGPIHVERCSLGDMSTITDYLHKPDNSALSLADEAFPGSRSRSFFYTSTQPVGRHRRVSIASWDESYDLMNLGVERFRQ
jgi:hypothetical protein